MDVPSLPRVESSADGTAFSEEPTSSSSRVVSDDDLHTALRVLGSLVSEDGTISSEFHEPRMKPLRVAMQCFLEDMRGKLFHGGDADKYAKRKENKRRQAAKAQQERAMDRQAVDKTKMRAERLRMLEQLQAAAPSLHSEAYVPDGAVDEMSASRRLLLQEDEVTDGAAVHSQRQCYTCKARYAKLHQFYAQLCPACAELNYAKRNQTADLEGRVVLITGARVKIGFYAAVKLLRCGARVIVTSRFPVDAAKRFAALPDAEELASRLQIVGLDLRDIASLEQLCAHLTAHLHHLDAIINNACQTIRRPGRYYQHLLADELAPTQQPASVQRLMLPLAYSSPSTASLLFSGGASSSAPAPSEAMIPSASAPLADARCSQLPLLSTAPYLSHADEGDEADFPLDVLDVNGQQIDHRKTNSWLLKLHEVSTPEVAEVLAVNALAPFIINSRLRPLLDASPAPHKFVVNVSAMEGKFYRYKTPNHPHTNMAKAALNMMTRTCAEDLSLHGILMNSVDTGWINDENPLEKAKATAENNHFQTPLDEIDAAARVIDPILSVINGGAPVCGKFLKDYMPCEW